MHTEHLQNVRPVRIMTGWLVAVAVTSITVFGLIMLGLMEGEGPRDTAWAVLAVAAGFLVGGWFTGMRTVEAPILHGIALGLTSMVVWAVVNVVAIPFGMDEWTGLTPSSTVAILLVQIAAAVAGCGWGTAAARRRASNLASSPATGVRGRGED